MAALATLGVAAAWLAGATLMFRRAVVFPLVEPDYGGGPRLA